MQCHPATSHDQGGHPAGAGRPCPIGPDVLGSRSNPPDGHPWNGFPPVCRPRDEHRWADPYWADPYWADPYSADPYSADPHSDDPCWSDGPRGRHSETRCDHDLLATRSPWGASGHRRAANPPCRRGPRWGDRCSGDQHWGDRCWGDRCWGDRCWGDRCSDDRCSDDQHWDDQHWDDRYWDDRYWDDRCRVGVRRCGCRCDRAHRVTTNPEKANRRHETRHCADWLGGRHRRHDLRPPNGYPQDDHPQDDYQKNRLHRAAQRMDSRGSMTPRWTADRRTAHLWRTRP